MALTKAQAAIWERARSLGSGGQAVALTDQMCAYLVSRIALDLEIQDQFPDFPRTISPFFTNQPLADLAVAGVDCRSMFERLVKANPDADTYFACLAALHKARLKYESILCTQPIPTLEQVGPRGLLQYGKLQSKALAALLFWRKWFYDIDNRAAQETGYLFEPIIAFALGGTPAPANKSPVKRHREPTKGRQVDCLLARKAYEFKIRVTIAASGQGRWQEELDFPVDCRQSGYKPVLVVMDGTPNEKLRALVSAFKAQKGEVYIGKAAWDHLESVAGNTMSKFISAYVRRPIEDLLANVDHSLPEFLAKWSPNSIEIIVGGNVLRIDRAPKDEEASPPDAIPEDADEEIPGV